MNATDMLAIYFTAVLALAFAPVIIETVNDWRQS